MRYQLVSWRNGKIVKKLHAYLTVALIQRQNSRVRDVLSGKTLYRDSKTLTIQCIFALFVILDDISRMSVADGCRFLYIIYNLVIRRLSASIFGAFQHLYSRIFHTPPSFHLSIFLSFSLFLFHVRYVRNLVVANSCMNVNAGRGRLYELFQFTSVNGESFHSFFLSSFSCLPFSFFSPHRIRSHEPYRGNSTFVFVFRRRRWLDWQEQEESPG